MERAAFLYARMLDLAVRSAQFSDCVLYSAAEPLDLLEHYGLPMELQEGKDLGERMGRALERERRRYPAQSVVLVGSDLPDLRPAHIGLAHRLLRKFDTVLGPARDGGYYLIGISGQCPVSEAALFTGLSFSHDQVAREAVARMASLGLTLGCTPPLGDLDGVHDLHSGHRDFYRSIFPD